MAKSNAIEKSELNKIIGESYFNLKKYEQAIPYLAYKGKKGSGIILIITNWVTYYKQNDFENAISQFNKIINGKDFVAKCLLPFRRKLLEVR
jgi:tetratricopeptide (TPR) repeat protein